ncbi:hypothetical protein Y032_0045g1186 [Ancylostoma ceylanicum]|uniref:Uncharacterized protein n=1 Tax=Ancylostoma ceylanicum TaxID=53326 RepID=A0A016UED6_9BILA|nr:hypothetical protein Y032_0045g1186 [Ancylostoma ceylanicum]
MVEEWSTTLLGSMTNTLYTDPTTTYPCSKNNYSDTVLKGSTHGNFRLSDFYIFRNFGRGRTIHVQK